MRIVQQVVILSAELSDKSFDENMKNSRILENLLKDCDYNFHQAIGVYKGKSETSFVVTINNHNELAELESFAFDIFNQESILYQDANQHAHLVFNNGKSQRLGLLKQVPKESCDKLDAYTILNGNYYAVA